VLGQVLPGGGQVDAGLDCPWMRPGWEDAVHDICPPSITGRSCLRYTVSVTVVER
jgi:hypothetical protein